MKKVGFVLTVVAFSSFVSIAGFGKDESEDLHIRHHRVGHSIRTINVTGMRGETRSVNVNLWYPALSSEDCENFGKSDANSGSSDADSHNSNINGGDWDCPATASVYSSRLHGVPLAPQWDPLSWTIGSTDSLENLPISEAHRSFPVIVFSHGNQGNAIDYVYTLESLASFGFIVAAPDHVNNTEDDLRLDFINPKINSVGRTALPCFDGLASPCDVSSRYKKDFGKDPPLDDPCPQVTSITPPVLPPTKSVRESMIDRASDIGAIIDALPSWFGERADISRVGVMGHSRGTVTALAAAGGSTCWGFNAEPRVKAIMGLAIGGKNVTFAADVQKVTVPALLVAGTFDTTGPPDVSQKAFVMLQTPRTEKACVLIGNAKHRHFDSGMCAETQSAGTVAEASQTRAILDLQTLTQRLVFPSSGVAMDFCGLDAFVDTVNNPPKYDIRPLVASVTGCPNSSSCFNITPDNVPTTGLTSDQVKNEVVKLAVIFFGHTLERDDNDPPFTDFLPPSVPDPTLAGCNLLTQLP